MERCPVCGGTVSGVTCNLFRCDYCGKLFGEDEKGICDVNAPEIYAQASQLVAEGSGQAIEEAINLFQALGSYKDSAEKAYSCQNLIRQRQVAEEEQRLNAQRQKELAEIERKKKRSKSMHILKVTTVTVVVGLCITGAVMTSVKLVEKQKQGKYEKALALYDAGQYEDALDVLNKISKYQDVEERITQIQREKADVEKIYQQAVAYYNTDMLENALEEFQKIPNYADVSDYLETVSDKLFQQAQEAEQNGDYSLAQQKLSVISDGYSISIQANTLLTKVDNTLKEQEQQRKYDKAISDYNNGDYVNAQQEFMAMGTYQDAASYLSQIGTYFYNQATELYNAKDYVQSMDALLHVDEEGEWSDYETAVNLEQQIKAEYIGIISEEAKNICRNDGYQSMVSYLENAAYNLVDDIELKNLIDTCTIQKIDLTELNPYVTEAGGLDIRSDYIDTLGNTYRTCLCTSTSSESSNTYAIDGKYHYLVSTIAIEQADNIADETKSVYIYGDGQLLWSDTELTKYVKPYSIQVDISGVTDLQIVMQGAVYASNLVPLLCDPVLSE